MTATFDRTEIISVVSGGKAGYANLKHLHVGSPGSDASDLGDTADLEELLAQGSSQGPQTHPGTFGLLKTLHECCMNVLSLVMVTLC